MKFIELNFTNLIRSVITETLEKVYKSRNCSDWFLGFSYSHCLYIFTYLISNFNATNYGGMTFVNVCRLLAFSSSAFNLFFYRSLVANSDCETSDSAVHACYLEFKGHFLVIDSEVNRTDCWNLVIRKIANF